MFYIFLYIICCGTKPRPAHGGVNGQELETGAWLGVVVPKILKRFQRPSER